MDDLRAVLVVLLGEEFRIGHCPLDLLDRFTDGPLNRLNINVIKFFGDLAEPRDSPVQRPFLSFDAIFQLGERDRLTVRLVNRLKEVA